MAYGKDDPEIIPPDDFMPVVAQSSLPQSAPEDELLGGFQQDQMQQSAQDPMKDAIAATPQTDKANASYTNQIKNTHPDDEVALALQAGSNATDAQQQAVHVERASSTADGGTNWGMALGQILAAGE